MIDSEAGYSLLASGDEGTKQPDDILGSPRFNTQLPVSAGDGDSCYVVCRTVLNRIMWGSIVSYAGLVSLMYAALSTQDTTDSVEFVDIAVASYAMNFPMSMLFAQEFFLEFSRLKSAWGNRDYGYIGASVGALLLAFLCTLAGISIAEDTINNTNIPFVNALGASGVGLFSFNTFSTRWVGGIYLILLFTKQLNRCFGHSNDVSELHQFTIDCDRYQGLEGIMSLSLSKKDLVSDIEKLYAGMNQYSYLEKKIMLLDSCRFSLIISVVLTYGSWQTLPMWFEKSRQGGLDFGGFMAQDSVAWFGMAASLSFYLSSAMQFFSDNLSFYNGMVSMPSGFGKPGSAKRCAQYVGLIALCHYWAYKSGKGMETEAVNLIKNGFSPENQSYLHNPIAFYCLNPQVMMDNWYWIFNVIAGNVVNGRGATNFLRKIFSMTGQGQKLKKIQASIEEVLNQVNPTQPQLEKIESIKQAIREGHQGLCGDSTITQSVGGVNKGQSNPG